jgi:hypothetical protein
MQNTANDILTILDACCESFTFPMLDNGYVYLAETRLTLFHSPKDWAITIEVFGFSPRSGSPYIHIYTFGSTLINRKPPEEYVSREAYDNYLENNPNNEFRFVYPLDNAWIDDPCEAVASSAERIILRDQEIRLPSRVDFRRHKIELRDPTEIAVYEVCRYLAAEHRDLVLATPDELRGNVPSELNQILQLNEWHHPDVVYDEHRPSNSETFRQLAEVLVTGKIEHYKPSQPPNTDWRNWPQGGTL